MPRAPIPTWFFALVVVRLGERFLVVEERAPGGEHYVPGGRVEPGEDLAAAAVRETREEAGIDVALEGVLRVEHTPRPDHARVRVVFVARPKDPEAAPRATPNEHTLGARWVTLAELRALPRRGDDALFMCEAVAAGAPVAPLSLLTPENAPW